MLIAIPAAADKPLPCGGIPEVGCCAQERVLYCEKGALKVLDCRKKPRCGWRKTGRYDCDTSGGADPTGQHAKLCFVSNSKSPIDLGAPENSCDKIPAEGCCFGDKLKLCQDGKLRVIDCRDNRFCGWRGVAQAYNCGTEGKADPKGKYPRSCPGAPDSGPLRFPDGGAKKATGKLAKKPGGCGGCACELGSTGESAHWALLLIGLGLFGGRRRRAQ